MPSKLLLIILLLTLCSCSITDHEEGPFISPTSQYSIVARVDATNKTNPKYAHVELILLDSSNTKLDSLDTGAGDFSKWAVGWMKNGDTVVLYSSDIGSRAWTIDTYNKFKGVELNFSSALADSAIKNRANYLKKLKYE